MGAEEDDTEPEKAGGSKTSPEPKEIYLGSLELSEQPFKEGRAVNVDQTRAKLAFRLLALLAAVIGVLLGLLAAGSLTVQTFDSTAGVVLSPIFALLGAATGYYYGKAER